MSGVRRRPHAGHLLAVLAVVSAAGGAGLVVRGAQAAGPPAPPATVLGQLPAAPRPPAPGQAGAAAVMTYAPPTHVDISAIDLHADIIPVGQGAGGTLGTPPLAKAKLVGWYDLGPAPGQAGSAILDAHVDSAVMSDYRGAFFTLGQARPGMRIEVTRADHTFAEFTVDEIQLAPKTAFPTDEVYTPTPYPSLRLITCGGAYDRATHEYLDDIIVYAHLTGAHPASAPATDTESRRPVTCRGACAKRG